MAYLGRVELKASDIRTSGVQTISGSSTNTVTLGGAVPSVQSAILTINGVTQATNTYTISGSTLTLVSGNFADGDVVEAVTINDVGTTIVPADGSVTLPKISAGTGSAGQYLKTDGVGTLSWSTVASTPDLTTEGDLYKNYTSITSDLTTPVDSDSNQGLIGPIPITADWTVAGDVTIW